ncbi:hypothetical protein Rxycam_01844 [Rubrobacter xylanophilus DSM 9941]|uniref:hypothetical protein n=1 Tax=Rubrobacter xylanophilus TaxID=49319 RepID=UPI001C64173F|nr:hypothetical protein [Rubrobacter xylanophilus]QYJ16014.1 hypothetical protein Rxycam_01844 [Rubrobacter xylanophilus DSM 9941]
MRRRARLRERRQRRMAVYRRRRIAAAVGGVLALAVMVLAVFAQAASGVSRGAVPVNPGNAAPDTVVAEAAGVSIFSPIRPGDLTGLGYHPEGESLLPMEPRGKNLSLNPLLRLFVGESTPEGLRFYVMDGAGREGPDTGALDAGAPAGTPVYSPVTGTIVSIRPDPMVEGANVVEIQPKANPDVRVAVSLVESEGSEAGVKSPVTAGMTRIGSAADSAEVLDPQLSSYTGDAGNHVTVSVFPED